MTLDRALAACNGRDVELFFSTFGPDDKLLPLDLDECRIVCGMCSQRRECLDDEMTYEVGMIASLRAGVYAGMTGEQRYSLERRGDALRCPCGELRDPIDLRAGQLVCAWCARAGTSSPIPDGGDSR